VPGVQESSARIAGLMYAEREAVWVNGGGQKADEPKRTIEILLFISGFSSILLVRVSVIAWSWCQLSFCRRRLRAF
jgi:hypothetical protein